MLVRHKPDWWLDGWLPRLIRACEELFADAPESLTFRVVVSAEEKGWKPIVKAALTEGAA